MPFSVRTAPIMPTPPIRSPKLPRFQPAPGRHSSDPGRVPATLTALILIATFSAATPALATWPCDPDVNVPLCTAAGNQSNPQLVADGAGGAIVAWVDLRNGNEDIYAQHVLASGVVDPAWPVNGLALCTAPDNQRYPTVVSDDAGGAIVTWMDLRSGASYDIYAQHVLGPGAVDPLWPGNGVAVCDAVHDQARPIIAPDGAGGAIITWHDYRGNVNWDIYAQRILVSGSPDPAWPSNGRALCWAANEQSYPRIVTDGGGGAIVTWQDWRNSQWDIYAQRVSAAGVTQWTSNGLAISLAQDSQSYPCLVSDGAGGAIITWNEDRDADWDIYAQRVLAAGNVDPAWPVNGRALCTASQDQDSPVILADDSGGAIVAWEDFRDGNWDVYAQRVDSSGTIQWTTNGRALCTNTSTQQYASITTDGAGGAIVRWKDLRNGDDDVYAGRVTAGGAVPWTADGVAVCTASGGQFNINLVTDGMGGAVITWEDARSGGSDIYAQGIDSSGNLGNQAPEILGIIDIPNDQGGWVHVIWSASCLDVAPSYGISSYSVWRQVTFAGAPEPPTAGRETLRARSAPPDADPPAYRVTIRNGQTQYWEYLGSVPVRGYAGYSFPAPTLGDSTLGGIPWTVYMVDAQSATSPEFWSSAPDSGYSVDNIAPGVPQKLLVHYTETGVELNWDPAPEPDFQYFRVYRGTAPDFIPSPATLVHSTAETGWTDPEVGPEVNYYKLTALDHGGNESLPASPSSVSGLSPGGAPPTTYALMGIAPTPFRSSTRIAFALPEAARVELNIFDASGRLVRTLLSGEFEAGSRWTDWDGRDDGGQVLAAGRYFCRLRAGSFEQTRAMVLIH